MNTIPTADELIDQYNEKFKRTGNPYWLRAPMKEFARLHVEAALKAASENTILRSLPFHGNENLPYEVDKDSILNSYPLSNIV